ncbi:MAG: isoleucine--tRNA ligase [Alphaproteobacteria bacterium]|nr:isoleucine--tRNA ligase [Alphaproteobacteria bacterium]
MTTDYKNTVFLPKTEFPMRGDLPQKEPKLISYWQDINLQSLISGGNTGKEKFILHDGPPYANGNLHIGHAVNKILKDVVNRTKQMQGYATDYVPGWDCHGLPIEWKIEEKYRAQKKNKDEVPLLQFRQECREFAREWVGVQGAEFQRLGVMGNWADPYTTMTYAAEAGIVKEIHKFAMNGGLYRDVKPVMWSTVEKTALADAEVEYHDHTSTAAYVKFPVSSVNKDGVSSVLVGDIKLISHLQNSYIVIWTTTPWTLPGNRAIAFGNDIDYAIYECTAVNESSKGNVGEKYVVAQVQKENFEKQTGVVLRELIGFKGSDLNKLEIAHPLRGHGYEFDVPLFAGEFVATETGTGFVHIAPNHGEDDYKLGKAHRYEIYGESGDLSQSDFVDGEGRYKPHTPIFAGEYIYNLQGKPGGANKAVLAKLTEVGALLASHSFQHSYPHSWRSKAPVIFRTTPQWFISMEKNDLRKKALKAIADTDWVPAIGENRIRSMVETRPDWCISRQRAWGVPIAIFAHKVTGEIIRDDAVNKRIADAFEQDGADAWFARPAQEFLGDKYKAEDYDQIKDIVDVWFESGSTHAFVLEARGFAVPADLYLEGSDQHRGWFHSSLLESCGTRGIAPFKAVLTHGFALDEQGRKMSKSLGNVVAPQEVIEKMGADILRLWIISTDYTEDLRVGPEILKQSAETYRRLRNTLRYVLGALDGFSAKETLGIKEMPELERWVLHRLYEVNANIEKAIAEYKFNAMLTELHNFCAVDLSALYFDIRKDSLYCDHPNETRRRAVRTVMHTIYISLTKWLAPILCFTAEEAWLAGKHPEKSVHATLFEKIPAEWRDDALATKWQRIRALRSVVTGAIEKKRAEKVVGSSLQATPTVYVKKPDADLLKTIDFADICITSYLHVVTDTPPVDAFIISDVPDVAVVVNVASGNKCERCWSVKEEVGKSKKHPTICLRCEAAVEQMAVAA